MGTRSADVWFTCALLSAANAPGSGGAGVAGPRGPGLLRGGHPLSRPPGRAFGFAAGVGVRPGFLVL